MTQDLLDCRMISRTAARAMLAICFDVARENSACVTIAITDGAGLLVALERGDGAAPASVAVAQSKARTAALYRVSTKALRERARAGHLLLPLPDLIAAPGGEPLLAADGVIGAIGVSGSTADIDVLIAQAGVLAAASLVPAASAAPPIIET